MSAEPQVYEAQILQQLIKNAERIAVIEEKLTGIEGQISDLRTEMSEMKTELQTEMSEMKTELQTAMSDNKTELQTAMSDIKSELKSEISEVRIKADRAEWWLRFIAGAVLLSFFKEQLMSFF